MGKYSKFQSVTRPQEKPYKVHPIWRGIGCLMMILIPLMAYAGAVLLVEENMTQRWLPMPWELGRTVTIPGVGISVPHLFANLILAVLLSLVGFGVLMIIYAFVYRLIGPPRYSPIDSPPVRSRPNPRPRPRR